ncbi:MAG: glycosyltransferase [Clostridia bacterium]|nr:glycosyltransferase [Bacilli bacterium]MBR3511506.1 glycosyltransferase [Clostridia bacterium]
MKKILHISKYYYPFRGGTEQIAKDCVNALKNDYEQKVICFNHEKKDYNDYIDDVEIIRCGCFAKLFSQSLSISYAKKLKQVIESFKPDIIIFHYPNPFVASLLLRYISKNSKLVIYWHLDIVKQKLLGKLFSNQNKKLINKSNKIIATSPNYIEGSAWLSSAKEKCVVIPNCINEKRLEPTEESNKIAKKIKEDNKGKTICVAVGRHTEYKGFEYLIKASKLLDNKFQIFIIGKGELTDKLKKEAANDEKVRFLGVVSDDELKAYYSAMDIYCFPSITKNEAFGLALAEAMYFGKPAVTFNIKGSGVNYVCLKNVNGIEVENKNIVEYANAIKRLANDEKLRDNMGNEGKNRVISNFLYTQFKDNITKAVMELF